MLELIVRLVLGGGIVVVGLLAWRHASRRGLTARGGPALRVVGRAGLTRSALVAVVEVDDRRYLVGAADQGVQLLADLGDALAADDEPTTADEPAALPGSTSLAAAFAATLGAHGRGTATTTTDGPRIGPLDRLREMTVRSHIREPIRAHPPEHV